MDLWHFKQRIRHAIWPMVILRELYTYLNGYLDSFWKLWMGTSTPNWNLAQTILRFCHHWDFLNKTHLCSRLTPNKKCQSNSGNPTGCYCCFFILYVPPLSKKPQNKTQAFVWCLLKNDILKREKDLYRIQWVSSYKLDPWPSNTSTFWNFLILNPSSLLSFHKGIGRLRCQSLHSEYFETLSASKLHRVTQILTTSDLEMLSWKAQNKWLCFSCVYIMHAHTYTQRGLIIFLCPFLHTLSLPPPTFPLLSNCEEGRGGNTLYDSNHQRASSDSRSNSDPCS